MGIFYDPYCSQYAGNDVNLKETTGVKFVKNIFAFTYHGKCLSCDQNVSLGVDMKLFFDHTYVLF